MGNLFAYSGLTTKICAMRARLLSREDYSVFVSMPNVAEALSWLKNSPGYRELFADMEGSPLHRGQIEKLLTGAIYSDFQSIYRFANISQRRFLDLYFHRYEAALLKRCLRMIFDHRGEQPDLQAFEPFFRKHSRLSLTKLAACQSTGEFTAALAGSIWHKALLPLERQPSPTLWDYEMTIDLFYFKWFYQSGCRTLERAQLLHFQEACGTKMDLLNILWICRSRRCFFMEPAEIYAHLIPVQHHLRPAQITALVEADGAKGFDAVLKDTWYGRHFEFFTTDTLQEAYGHIRSVLLRRAAFRDPCSCASVISYLFEKEHEVSKITTALEGVRYGLPPEEILKLIRG